MEGSMMRTILLLALALPLMAQLPAVPGTPTPVIIDGDLGNDISIDDGFYAAIRLHKLGYLDIRAAVTGGPMTAAGAYLATYLRYAGLGHIPIGTFQGLLGPTQAAGYSAQYVENDMCAYVNAGTTPQPGCLTNMAVRAGIAPNFPVSAFPEPVAVIRKALAAAVDGTIVMIETGPAQVFAAVMNSPADGIDSRTGVDLITAKVSYLLVMGGDQPSGTEWNVYHAPSQAADINANWPTAVYYIPYSFGFPNPTAGTGIYSLPDYNPLKIAHQIYGSETRNQWDSISVLWPVMGTTNGYFNAPTSAVQTINSTTGANSWSAGTHSPARYYITQAASNAAWTALINSLLTADIGVL
jgi:hypothetical protein